MKNKRTLLSDEALYQQMLKEAFENAGGVSVMHLSVSRKLSPAIVQKVSLTTSEAPQLLPQKAPSPQHKQTVIKVTPPKEANEVSMVKEQPLEMTASTDSISSNERQQIQEQIENALFELQLIDTVINYALTYQDINTL